MVPTDCYLLLSPGSSNSFCWAVCSADVVYMGAVKWLKTSWVLVWWLVMSIHSGCVLGWVRTCCSHISVLSPGPWRTQAWLCACLVQFASLRFCCQGWGAELSHLLWISLFSACLSREKYIPCVLESIILAGKNVLDSTALHFIKPNKLIFSRVLLIKDHSPEISAGIILQFSV